jgi:LacI family transcriptional regulator
MLAGYLDLKHDLRFIRDNAAVSVGVSEVANACCISRRSLEQKFRTHLDCTPGETIRKARMENVRRLLLDTDKSVSTIALECGFASTASLCQAFQKQYGESPGHFQQNGS